MINTIYLKNITEGQIDLKSNTTQEAPLLLAKYKQMLLAQLKVGDLLKGILTKGDDQNYMLELKQGIKLPVTLIGEAEVGKVLEFMVQKNQEGKLYLNVKDGEQQNILDKVITTLSLPATPEMENCIKAFIEGNLSLDKETLLQSHYLHKKLELPTPVIANLLERVGMLDMPALEKVGQLKQGGLLALIEQLKGIIQELPGKEAPLRLLSALTTDLPAYEVKELLLIGKALDTMQNIPKTVTTLESLEKSFDSVALKDFYIKLFPEEADGQALLKGHGHKLMDVLEEPQHLKASLFKLLDKLLIFNSKAYETSKVQGEDSQSKPIVETYKYLAKVVNELEKMPLENQGKQQLTDVRETLSILGKLNTQADYFMFPFMPSLEKAQGEVYFFKPKKKDKKAKEEIYAVVALDLPALNHLEIHVKKYGKNLALSIHTETKAIEEHMERHMPVLGEALESMGYAIGQCTYKLLGEGKKGLDTSYAHIKLTSLDVKA